ncbi:MAG: non-specific endonuclease [Gemmatimonadetes bacterium]|nr:non-specific endonuclease [Gemmatimonadota bacterium]
MVSSRHLNLGLAAVFAVFAAAACSDRSAVAPEAGPAPVLPTSPGSAIRALDCVVNVRGGTIGCGPEGLPAGVHADAVVGGQNVYVRMASTNVAYDPDGEVLSADVTVQNLLPQAMGTRDGTAVDSAGIKVFFTGAPVTQTGTGSVTVTNADGTGTFLGGSQQFFRYDEKLDSGQVSAPKSWHFAVPVEVTSFTFKVYVATPLKPLMIINELMSDPAVVVDSLGEWLEVYNRGLDAVDLFGWQVASLNDATQTINVHINVPPRGYAVLGKKTDPTKNGNVNVQWSFGPINLANNTTDWVALRTPTGASADSVINGTAPTSGRSRGVVDPAADNTTASGTNWSLATSFYGGGTTNKGTPGAANDGSTGPVTPPTSAGPARSVVMSPDSATVIVGTTRQFTATARDSANQVTTSTYTWNSLNASVASVATNGLVTANAVGLTQIIVTAATGVADTANVRVDTATAGPSGSQYLNHLEFGRPMDADSTNELMVRHTEYVLSYSPKHAGPNWVAWDLNLTHFGAAARCNCFAADPTLPDSVYHVVTSDYTGSGYSRGHMVMSEERTASDLENLHAFYMTNILPQYQDMNGGPWLLFENYANDLARTQNKEIYIISGGIWPANPSTLSNKGVVEIPTSTWKVIVVVPRGTGLSSIHSTADLKVYAVNMPNVTGILGQPWQTYQTTVDAIEAATGYDLLALLPDDIEAAVESTQATP